MACRYTAAIAMNNRSRITASSSYMPGYNRALNEAVISSTSTIPSPSTLALSLHDDQLPDDCYLVEQVISVRKHKVSTKNTKIVDTYQSS